MQTPEPTACFRLLKDFKAPDGTVLELSDLRRQISAVPGLTKVVLTPEGISSVVAIVPARNQRQKDHLRDLLRKNVRGWKVIDEVSYRLPATF